jgi:hypothetical protein
MERAREPRIVRITHAARPAIEELLDRLRRCA